MKKTTASRLAATFAGLFLYAACAQEAGHTVHGGETNWLAFCRADADCTGSATCVCGVCTRVCSANSACGDITDGACALRGTAPFDRGCSGNASIHGACFQRCGAERCSGSRACIDGLCVPAGGRDASASATAQPDAARPRDSGAPSTDGATTPDAPLEPGCFELRAHGAQSAPDDSPYTVMASEYIHEFYFDVPYTGSVEAARFEALVDGSAPDAVQHIWLFEKHMDAAHGTHANTIGLHLGDDFLYAWAPGLEPFELPPDVGAYLPNPGGHFTLEILYTNSSGSAQSDRSGVRVCTTPPRTHQAQITVLGTETISIEPGTTGDATGTCTPSAAGGDEIHLLAAMPHMHRTGREMSATIERAAGGAQLLLDVQFDFAHHRIYQTPQVVQPGDRLITSCSYFNDTALPVSYGPSASFEHCYDFVYAYPPGALAGNPQSSGSLLGSGHMCLH